MVVTGLCPRRVGGLRGFGVSAGPDTGNYRICCVAPRSHSVQTTRNEPRQVCEKLDVRCIQDARTPVARRCMAKHAYACPLNVPPGFKATKLETVGVRSHMGRSRSKANEQKLVAHPWRLKQMSPTSKLEARRRRRAVSNHNEKTYCLYVSFVLNANNPCSYIVESREETCTLLAIAPLPCSIPFA